MKRSGEPGYIAGRMPGGSGPRAPRGRLGLLFLAVLVDLVGFGIVLPLLPLYARDLFGADGFQVGLLVAVYSLVQLVMAPLWGRLSDRVGRRPVLILGLLGSAAAYVIFARADSLAMLFMSRIVGGIGGSTIPVAQAYIADVTPPTRRAGNLGLIGAAFGFGFVIGPALGGFLADVTPASPAAPGYTAAALCLVNALAALIWLPESRQPGEATRISRFNFRAALTEVAGSRQIQLVLAVYLFVTMAFSTLQPTLSLLASERFAMGTRQAGYLFALLGIVSVIVQGGLVRKLVPRFGERRLLRASAIPFCLGLVAVGVANTTPVLLVGLVLIGIGYGGSVPNVLALLSRATDPGRQGAVLGIGQSVGSTARVVGPVLAGNLFDVRLALPYFAGTVLILVAAAVATRVLQPRKAPS